MASDKVCKNCDYGLFASSGCGFYPPDREEGCHHFKEKSEFYGHEITIKCDICGNGWTVSKDDANYAHRYGGDVSLPICSECKKAVKFVKWFLQKHPIRLNDEKGFIHEVEYINTRNDNGEFD